MKDDGGSLCSALRWSPENTGIDDPLMQKIRWLDKLIDELAKGKKILRAHTPLSGRVSCVTFLKTTLLGGECISESNRRYAMPFASALRPLLAIFAVGLGVAIYALWRDRALLAFQALEMGGVCPLLDVVRAKVHAVAPPELVPKIIRFVLPDALWVFAWVLVQGAIWGFRSRQAAVWMAIGWCVAMLSEFAQGAGILRGTFDPMDIAAYGLGLVGGVVVNRRLQPSVDAVSIA